MSSRSAAGAQRSARQPRPPQPQPLPPPLATAALLAPACRAPQSDSRRAPTQPTDPRTQPRSHQPPAPRPPHLSPTGGIHGAREPRPTIPEQCESTLESSHLAPCAGAAGEGGVHQKKARFGLGMPPACRAPQSDGLRAPTQPTDPPPPPPRPPHLSPTGGIHGARDPSPTISEQRESTLESIHISQRAGAAGEGGGAPEMGGVRLGDADCALRLLCFRFSGSFVSIIDFSQNYCLNSFLQALTIH